MITTGVYGSTYYYENTGNLSSIDKNRFTDFALGFGVGSKWITKKGFVFEINVGLGRN